LTSRKEPINSLKMMLIKTSIDHLFSLRIEERESKGLNKDF
jgi:hypothetical protein